LGGGLERKEWKEKRMGRRGNGHGGRGSRGSKVQLRKGWTELGWRRQGKDGGYIEACPIHSVTLVKVKAICNASS